MPFTSIELDHAGQALFGPDYKKPLAAALQVEDRTFRRWLADPSTMPPGVEDDIRQLCVERISQLTRVVNQMEGGGFQRQVNVTMRKPTPRRD